MNPKPPITDIPSQVPEDAVSVYSQNDALDDFPVLKAFQQYIDAEQTKARKRLMMLCVFFSFLMMIVVTFFLIMLMNISSHNQALSDRLLEFVVRDRDRPSATTSPVVVQPTTQDSSAIQALNAKIEELQRLLSSEKEKDKTEKDTDVSSVAASTVIPAQPPQPTPEQLEIKRLKELLNSEREKNSAEKERKHQEEIEAYRRKYYPELYAPKPQPQASQPVPAVEDSEDDDELDNDTDEEIIEEPPKKPLPRYQRPSKIKDSDLKIDNLDDIKPISYFDTEEDAEEVDEDEEKKISNNSPSNSETETDFSIPVEGASSSWQIPND